MTFINNYSFAFNNYCDNTLKINNNSSIAYKHRQNRCEGFYISEVGSETLCIVNITKGKFTYELDQTNILKVVPLSNKNQRIKIRAQGIPLKLYYRMDAVIETNQILDWPLMDVIYHQKLISHKIGITGKLGDKIKNRDIYVPLQVTTTLSKPKSFNKQQPLYLILRSSVAVENVQYKTSLISGKHCATIINSETILSESTFYPGDPITIILENMPEGNLCIDVSAMEKNTDNWFDQYFIVQNQK